MAAPSARDVQRLNDAINQALSSIQIRNGRAWNMLATIRDFRELLLRHEPWRSHLSPFDVSEILRSRIALAIQAAGASVNGPIPDVMSASTFAKLKRDILDFLLSLPRTYELWLELPAMPSWGAGTVSLAHNVQWIEFGEEGVLEDHKKYSGTKPGKPSRIYLQIACLGYGARRIDSSAVADGVATLKTFLAIASDSEIFEETFEPDTPDVECVLVDSAIQHGITVHVPTALQTFISTFTVNETAFEPFDDPKATWGREDKLSVMRKELSSAIAILNCPPDLPDAVRIKTALEWRFDSSVSDNQTLSLLQACIGLEALLGADDQDEPLTTRLADRCAYLLGQGTQQRNDIRQKFKEIYDVRSKLVHGRRARLGVHERQILHSARKILGDVIGVETRNLLTTLRIRDKQSGPKQ